MQIHVLIDAAQVTDQTRAYAEYRVFSRLAPLARDVGTVLVVLSQSAGDGHTVCHASAELGDAGCVRARTRRAHPTAAIDAVADKLAAEANRRLPTVPAME